MSISVTAAAPRRTVLDRVRLQRPELALLILTAAVLDLWSLGRNGWANTYYSAAVHSMSTSWHNFLYASFDQAGVMTVDKPPLALWVQALSARIFGFNSLSILVPQALMSIGTVVLAYDLTRRRFGRFGGFAAGLVLATTPMTVAIARHNNPDALLVLCCVAALWFIVRALEDGRMRWVVLSGVCVGLGFETKMLAALLVVPAIALAYFWVAPRGRAVAVRQLAAGGAAMAVVGLAWPVLVWLTPASSRPWVSGTSDNSIWSLIFGYNGLGRLDGQMGGPGGGAGPARPGNGGPFGGSPGALRLFNDALGGQAGWLLGAAAVGAIGLVIVSRLRRGDPRTGWVIAVGGSFATIAIAFSTAKGIFHPYYVSLLAPFTAALVGAAVTTRLAPLAIAAGFVTELMVLHHTDGSLNWVVPLLVIAVAVTAGVHAAQVSARVRAVVVAAAMGLLLLAPATWAAQTLGYATSATFPAGGPATASSGGGGGGFGGRPGGGGFRGGAFGGNSTALTQAAAYVKAHGGGTIAVSSQQGASDAIINSGVDVAALGGFSGRESEVSVSWLKEAVKDGRVRYVLVDGSGATPNDGRVGSRSIMAYAAQVGTKVLTTGGGTLYELS
jgi:4-amino-4-deoxy-L-arabinose transferase-like glycosyltransferase